MIQRETDLAIVIVGLLTARNRPSDTAVVDTVASKGSGAFLRIVDESK